MSTLAIRWTSQFFATLGDDRLAADELREASVRSDLARWTSALTSVVVRSFETLGWAAAGKGHRCTVLPVKRNEYLSQDVMAFSTSGEGWRFPLAVCELENSADGPRRLLAVEGALRSVRSARRLLLPARHRRRPCVRRVARGRCGRGNAYRRARVARRRDAGDRRLAQRRRDLPLRILSDVEAQLQHGAFRALRAAMKVRRTWR